MMGFDHAEQTTVLFARFFTALHCMQRGICDRKGVCLSVRRVNCEKKTKVLPTFLYHMKGKFMYFFGHKQSLVEDAPLYLKFWVKLTHPASKTAIFTRNSLVAAQPLDLAKKVHL